VKTLHEPVGVTLPESDYIKNAYIGNSKYHIIWKRKTTNMCHCHCTMSVITLIMKTRGPNDLYRSPTPQNSLGFVGGFWGYFFVIFSTKCFILNINAFRPVIRQKTIFEGFCYIYLPVAICDPRDLIWTNLILLV